MNILKHPMKNTPLRYAVKQLSSPMGILPPPCYLCRRRTGKSFSFTFSGITHSRKSGIYTGDQRRAGSRGEMLMYGKEASNQKQEIDRQHHTIPNKRNQRAKDKYRGNVYNLPFRHG